MDKRPVLIGMNNPISSDPEHALYPWPEGCTGHRIYRMICDASAARGAPEPTDEQYLSAFDRRNLIGGRSWPTGAGSAKIKQAAAGVIAQSLMGGERRVVLLGAEVRRAFGLVSEPLGCERTRAGFWIYALPHPSGLCRWYNELGNRARAAELLRSLYAEGSACATP